MSHSNTKTAVLHGNGTQLVETYQYTMADGSPGYFKDRLFPKKFLVWHRGPTGRRRSGKGPNDPGLYNLPAVFAAVERGEEIWFCEGEKDADAVNGLGVVATTAGGAGQLPSNAGMLLEGASINFILDDDPAGRRVQAKMEAALGGVAASLRFFLPAAGNDAFDHVVTYGLPLTDLIEVAAGTHVQPAPYATPPRSVPRGSRSAGADDRKAAKLRELAGAKIGDRHTLLNAIAFNLMRFAHGGTYSITGLRAELTQVALNLSLPMSDIKSTLRSAERDAARSPRTWYMAGRTEIEDAFVAQVKQAALGAAWRGKGGRYRYRVILGLIEVLMKHTFSPDEFPASERDIAKACGAKDRSSLRKALADLGADGWLTVVQMGNQRKATTWCLQMPQSFSNISDAPSNSVLPCSKSGWYSEPLPISHAAFFPSCLGVSAHQVLLHLSVENPMTVRDLTCRTGQSPSTTRRTLKRLNETGIATFANGWRLVQATVKPLADSAALQSGAEMEQRRFRRRLDNEQRWFRAFVDYWDTPAKDRPAAIARTGVILILQAA